MAKILVITGGKSKKSNNRNTECAENISAELAEIGHSVFVYSATDKSISSIGIIKELEQRKQVDEVREKKVAVKEKRQSLLNRIVTFLVRRLYTLFYPYPFTSLNWLPIYKDVVKEGVKYDVIITPYFTLQAVISGYKIKKKYPSVKWFILLTDSISNAPVPEYMEKSKAQKRARRFEKIFFSKADHILIMQGHWSYYQKHFSSWKDKFILTDIPLLLEQKAVRNELSLKNTGEVIFLFIGTFYKFRNPEKLLELFSIIYKNGMNIRFRTHSIGYEEMIQKYLSKEKFLEPHQLVSPTLIPGIIARADILVNIANKGEESVPGKIFEYMSSGKKILHIFQDNMDSSVRYLKKYPNILLIDERDSDEKNIEKIISFINKEVETVSFEQLNDIFAENTPKYSAQLISENI